MNNFAHLNGIALVSMSPSSPNFISLQTRDAAHGDSQRFLVYESELRKVLEDPDYFVLDTDLGNFLQIHRIDDQVHFRVTWLSLDSRGEARGYLQTFDLPVNIIESVLEGIPYRQLVNTLGHWEQARLVFTESARSLLHWFCQDRLNRRALSKFLRDNLHYSRPETLVLFDDSWVQGFYFESARSKYNGGIVLHETEVRGKDQKKHRKVSIELHT